MHIRRSRRWLAVPLAGALALAACGGDDDDDAASTEHRGRRPAAPSDDRRTGDDDGRDDRRPARPAAALRPATSTCRRTARRPSSSRPTGTPRPSTAGSTRWSATATRIDKDAVVRHRPARRLGRRRHRRRHRDPLRRPGDRLPDRDVAAVHRRRHPPRLRLHRRGDPERGRVPDRGDHGRHGEEPADDHVGPGDVPGRRDASPTSASRAILVRYFGGAAYMDYFTQTGILSPDQVDGSYDGTPANFVAAEGADAQQGFGSAEPYIYENEIADWGKPVAYDYINDAGWENYAESIATKPENIETYRACFEKLVPIIQQSTRRLHRRPGRDQRPDHRGRRDVRQRLGLQRGRRRLRGGDDAGRRPARQRSRRDASATSTSTGSTS